MPEKDPNTTPVTILAGFLGAGKTTLLNRILNHPHGLRVAVMINDFGTLNIDAQLVSTIEEDMTISLQNGCICCNIRDDLLKQTLELLRREQPPEYIIVEASGVSDPLAIAQTFSLPDLAPILTLDSIITLIDAEQFDQLKGEYAQLAYTQAAVADVIIINKADLVTQEHLTELKQQLERLHPRIFQATQGDIPLELLIGLDNTASPKFSHEHDPHSHVNHSAMFDSWRWTSETPFIGRALRRVLRQLPAGILRAKGILNLKESPDHCMVLQMVGARWSLTVGRAWENEPPYSQIVAISMAGSVNFNQLNAMFNAAMSDALDPSAPSGNAVQH